MASGTIPVVASAFTVDFDKAGFFNSSTGVQSVDGRKSSGFVEAYIRLTSENYASSGGTIGTIKSAYRPSHTVCFPLFGYSSPYAPVGSVFIYSSGVVEIYYSAQPQYIYAVYAIPI